MARLICCFTDFPLFMQYVFPINQSIQVMEVQPKSLVENPQNISACLLSEENQAQPAYFFCEYQQNIQIKIPIRISVVFMISFKIYPLLLLFLTTLATSPIDIRAKHSTIQQNKEWIRFKVGVDGGIKPYHFLYDQYPKGWKPVFSFMYIKKRQLVNNRRYPVKMRVRDYFGNSWKGTIVIEAQKNKIEISEEIYPYSHQFQKSFFNLNSFKGIPEMSVDKIAIKQFQQDLPKDNRSSKANQAREEHITKTINSLTQNPGSSSSEINQLVNYIVNSSTKAISLRSLIKDLDPNSKTISYSYPNSKNLSKIQNNDSITPQKSDNENKSALSKPNNTLSQEQKTLTRSSPPVPSSPAQPTTRKPIDKIFLRLPTQKELDGIILAADSVAILKTIQSVIRSDLNCTDKVYYLQDFLGRIQSAIQMKRFSASQLSVIIEAAQQQILRLEGEIESERQRIEQYGIEDLKRSLNRQLQKLQSSYNEFNSIEEEIVPEQAKVAGFQSDIQKLREQNNEYRSLVSEEKIKLVQAESDISRLQIALKNANNKKKSILDNINKLEGQITTIQQQIQQNFQQMRKLQANIDRLQEKSDQVKVQSKVLEISVERIQNDLIEAQEKEDKNKQRLERLNEKIRLEKLKLVQEEHDKLANMVELLERALPSVKEQIDRFNYECQQLQLEAAKNKQNVLVYIVGQKDYSDYITNIYGDVPVHQAQIKSSLELNTLTILSPDWKSVYGSPFNSKQMVNANSFSFNGDFNCLEPSQLVSGGGIIREIAQKTIFVEVNESGRREEYELNLGACSRIEATAQIPKIGQSIYWKGNKVGDKIFNTYRVTCL